MVEGISDEELYKHQFMGFVGLLTNSAMQQLGKLVNPVTGKAERNLEGAKATIDMVKMLQVKTKGNLSKEEQQVLDTSLIGNLVEIEDGPAAVVGDEGRTMPLFR